MCAMWGFLSIKKRNRNDRKSAGKVGCAHIMDCLVCQAMKYEPNLETRGVIDKFEQKSYRIQSIPLENELITVC